MKSIFKSHLNGGANLLKNKKLLFAAVLSSVAINCDATLQRIDNCERKVEAVTFGKLHKYHLQIVSMYLQTQGDFEEFKSINKTCRDAVDTLHFNPIPVEKISLFFWTPFLYANSTHNFHFIREDKYELFFPKLETQYLYDEYDVKISKVDYKKTYEVYYPEYLKDIETGDYKKTEYARGIIVSEKQYEEEEEKRLAELEKDSDALKNTMAQFIIDVDYHNWEKLPDARKEKFNKLEKDGTIKRLRLLFGTFIPGDIDQFGEAHIPYGVNVMCGGDLLDSGTRQRIKSMTIPETVYLFEYGTFRNLSSLRLIRFGNANVVFEGASDTFEGGVFDYCKSLEIVIVKVKNEKELAGFKLRVRTAGLPKNVLVVSYGV